MSDQNYELHGAHRSVVAFWKKRRLRFKTPAGTSRGVLTEKPTWYLIVEDTETKRIRALGECSPIPDLSVDDLGKIEEVLENVCRGFEPDMVLDDALRSRFPCVAFGLESVLLDLCHEGDGVLFPSDFTEERRSISINGLIWMGDAEYMRRQIKRKIEENYSCIKIKIGALDFDHECAMLADIRKKFGPDSLDLRVDANGAFTPQTALRKLQRLAAYRLHSIEQPIAPGQWECMADLCRKTPVPIALDEELIGVTSTFDQARLLEEIKPHYIVLKPSLLGGFLQSERWIDLAEKMNVGWWVTSALESAVGLNAIAQWTASLGNLDGKMAQGLGAGKIYDNDLTSPLYLNRDRLRFRKNPKWSYSEIRL